MVCVFAGTCWVAPTVSAVPSVTVPSAASTKSPVRIRARTRNVAIHKPIDPAVSASAAVAAITPFQGKVVGTVEVQAQKRIERDAILNKIGTKPGQPLLAESVRSDIQAMFGMGFFDDISVAAEAGPSNTVNLVYTVRERPVVSKVDFQGNERISTSDLKDVVKVKEWSILDVAKVREDVALLQKHYEDKGFYLAKVSFELKPGQNDDVELTYKVNDYEKVQIKKITFLNNKRFSDEQLKSVFRETKEGGAFSFLNGSGNFKESAFKQDLQILTLWYLDHGYVKFQYENPVVTISDDKRFLYLTLYVNEGEQYVMGTQDFSGDLLYPKEDLKKDVTLLEGETFSITKRNFDIQRLTEKYQDLGYAFVNVVPKMNVHDDTRKVDIEYGFEKGNLVHFGEISVLGNSKTHDKVIRRELKIAEGELYSGTKLRQSRENVERLGFFAPGEVIFNTISPKGKSDILNVEISVKERSTGTITLGAGYGSVQKFFFTTQVAEINLLGRGQNLSLTAQLAADRSSKSFNLGFTDPYSFDSRWSLGFDLYFVNFPIPDNYTTRKLGFNLRAGYPILEFTNAYVTYKNEGVKIEDPLVPLTADDLSDQGILSSLVYSVIRDKRNNRFETTEGNYQSVSLETAGLGGDKRFIKWTANNRYYQRIIGDLVFRNSFEYGQIEPLSGRAVPTSERFFLGGPNNLKGFQLYSVGPNRIVPSVGNPNVLVRKPLGGNAQLFGLFELEYPLVREAGLKFVTFYDVGNSFSEFPTSGNFTVRSDAGFGFRWFSPIGPLRFEWGFPFARKPNEDTSVFNFFIGPPF